MAAREAASGSGMIECAKASSHELLGAPQRLLFGMWMVSPSKYCPHGQARSVPESISYGNVNNSFTGQTRLLLLEGAEIFKRRGTIGELR